MNLRTLPLLIIVIAALVLAGCASPTTAPATEPAANTQSPTEKPANTKAPTVEPSPIPAKPTTPAPVEGRTSYQIVASESKVSYEVGETFINQDNRFNLAVGVTSLIEGEIVIDRSNPQDSTIGPITVDISQFASDSSRRDNYIRNNGLESSRFPLAVFTPTLIEGLPADGVEGQSYEFKVTGDLKVKEVVRSVTFTVAVSLTGDELTGSAETTILMSDFGVGPISLAGILNTEDKVLLKFNFVARP